MAKRKQELEIHCTYTQNGDILIEILRECFRTFLYKELQNNGGF